MANEIGELPEELSTLTKVRDGLKSGALNPVEVVEAFARNMEAGRGINAFITETIERAMDGAKAAVEKLKGSEARPLEGVPIAVKDNFCTKGVLSTAGSKILHNFVPTYESTVTSRLWEAGALLLGKTNLDEFAMGSTTETSHFGPTINPTGLKLGLDNLTPGGSSGGSAAAVAAGMAPGAIGSDTGGSIRQPASFCGVVGMKPTYGLCSRWGIMAYASSLDQAGALGHTVRDVAILLDVIMGEDEKDTTSCPRGCLNLEDALETPMEIERIAIPKEIRQAEATEEAELVWQRAEELVKETGCEIVEVSMPHLKYALPAYYIIALSEASSNLARYDGVRYGYRAEEYEDLIDMYEKTRAEGFGLEAKRRIMMGTHALSAGYYDAYYKKAQQVRAIVANEFAQAFKQADLMLMPAAPAGAYELGKSLDDPLQMYLGDVFTVPVNMAGLPGLSLPVAKDARGMPLGLQVIGPRFFDDKVVAFADKLERALA